jgi:ABC-2 type transport system permease protein
MLTPMCSVLAWYSGFQWSAPLVGIVSAVAMMALAAVIRTIADTGLRMSLAPSQLRNVQAVAAILGMPLIYFALAFGQMRAGAPSLSLAKAAPDWLQWTPPGLLASAINGDAPLAALAMLLAQLVLALWAGMQLLRYQLRDGVVASGSRESSRAVRPPPPPERASGLARLLPQSTIKRRELRLLGRDRNFLIQSLLLPIIIVGSQLVLSGSSDALVKMASSPAFLAGLASGIASYMLMLSAFQTLHNEGQSLWMLYTFPRPIESVLREKAEFWGVLAMLYTLLLLGVGLWAAPGNAAATLALFVVVLVGVPIFSVIAVALGVFGCDPLSQDTRTKIKPSFAYLYMLLSGMMVYAVNAPQWPQKLVVIVLLASLALALWQKARDQLPYLLDPAASPPNRVSTSDGLIAAVLFFVLQASLMVAFIKLGKMPPPDAMVFAFSITGLLVYVIMRFVYLLLKTREVPAMLGARAHVSVAMGVGAGVVAAGLGIGYLLAIRYLGLFPDAMTAGAGGTFKLQMLFALAVVAAPLAEEFIFRGLVFGGLRRSLGLMPSMLMSAALFAIVHPPASMIPVFVLGLGAAWLYERTRSLLAPVLMHAVYNAVVLAWQVLA